MKDLIMLLKDYAPFNEQEERDRDEIMKRLIRDFRVYERINRTAHMSASAWVVSPDRQYVLMAYHNLYRSWSWLGGHADGERDLMQVAQREVTEESGVQNVRPLSDEIFSVEILTVDGHEKRGEYVPSHLHLNVTYLFEADMDENLRVKPDENSAVGWIRVDELEGRVSEPWMMERIYTKLRAKVAQMRERAI